MQAGLSYLSCHFKWRNSMSKNKKILKTAFAVLCMISMLIFSNYGATTVRAAFGCEFVILNTYARTLKIGDTFQLIAVTTNGKKPSFSSGSSAVASVNTYGKITAKKAGTTVITAKIRNGEASCKITVEKTKIELSAKSISLENGESAKLKASVSTGHPVKYKSSKSSVASVDEDGVILAKKPGTATITVKKLQSHGKAAFCQTEQKLCLSFPERKNPALCNRLFQKQTKMENKQKERCHSRFFRNSLRRKTWDGNHYRNC